uniref:Tumor suppressor p53 n=2 Tax=Artemia sinica TaxID=112780 RepID=A0A1V0JAM3_9CRUS|nr:tumor suppressor p53 [Artemia sinica]
MFNTKIDEQEINFIAEIEEAGEKILNDKREIIAVCQQQNWFRESVRSLQKSEEEKIFMRFGSSMFKIPKKNALKFLNKGNEELKKQEMDLRKILKDSVMVLSQIEDSPGMKGLNLSPLGSEERKAISDLIGD